MKKSTFITLLLLIIVPFSVVAQKQKKAKKPKKPYEWVMPEKLAGVEELDDYILSCDTIWNRMQTYKDSINFFKVDTILTVDKETNTPYWAVKIVDEEGTEKSFSQTLLQYLQMTSSGIGIIGDAAVINLKAVSAGTSLLSNPLLSFSYGKYLKAGPQIVGLAYNEFKEIVEASKQQSQEIKDLRAKQMERSTDTTIILEIPEGTDINLADAVDINEINMGDNTGVIEIPEELAGLADIEIEIPEDEKK